MGKASSTPTPEAERKAVDEWAREKKTKSYVLAAVKAAANWAEGKMLTESEYDGAVDGWLHGSMDGRC